MNKTITILAASLCAAMAWSCADPNELPEELEPVTPVVEFAVEAETMEVSVEAPVDFKAVIRSQGPVECTWSINDEIIAKTPETSFTFTETGTYNVDFRAFNTAGEVTKHYDVTVLGLPVGVEYSFMVDDEPVEAAGDIFENVPLLSEFTAVATVVEGDRDSEMSWTLTKDATVVKTVEDNDFEHVFTELGTYTLTYKVENRYGEKAAKSVTIKVIDLPLEIVFTPEDETPEVAKGRTLEFKAEVVHGAEGLASTWTLDGEPVSEELGYVFTAEAKGDYTVVYSGSNAKGETASKTWTVTVTDVPVYAIGDYWPNAENPEGIVFSVSDGGLHGKVIHLKEAVKWGPKLSEAGAGVDWMRKEPEDGKLVTKQIIELHKGQDNFKTDYPAFNWIFETLNDGNLDGAWYVPSRSEIAEFAAVMSGFDYKEITDAGWHFYEDKKVMPGWFTGAAITARDNFKKKFTDKGGIEFNVNGKYATTWENSNGDSVWCFQFNNSTEEKPEQGCMMVKPKSDQYTRVRPIRTF